MVHKSVVSLACFISTTACVAASASATITFTRIGTPTFQPVGGVVFAAPIGTPADGYNEFYTTQETILPPPYSLFNPTNQEIIPGAAHPGPYNAEVTNGVAAAGYKTGSTFTTSDYSNGNGIYLALEYVTTAASPTGSSPDYKSGPVIPNSIFPLNYSGETDRNGEVFDADFTGTIPDVNNIISGLANTNYDGFSHFPQFYADAYEFGPTDSGGNLLDPIYGNYTQDFRVLDASGNGWLLTDSFTVVPEPTTLGVFAIAGSGLLGRRRRSFK